MLKISGSWCIYKLKMLNLASMSPSCRRLSGFGASKIPMCCNFQCRGASRSSMCCHFQSVGAAFTSSNRGHPGAQKNAASKNSRCCRFPSSWCSCGFVTCEVWLSAHLPLATREHESTRSSSQRIFRQQQDPHTAPKG